MASPALPRYEVIGVPITPVTQRELLEAIAGAVLERSRFVMVSQNLHSVYLYYRDADVREIQGAADCVRVDGMPLVWFGRLAGVPVRREHRFGWMDWIDSFMEEAERRSWRVFFIGSRPEAVEKAMAVLRSRYPLLEISGTHGYFDPDGSENAEVVAHANSVGADILIVGMGMPRQERWLLQNRACLRSPVLLTCGACMDYVAGDQAIPPRWLGQVGLEWLFRLLADPRRMWRRYLVEPFFALSLFISERLALRQRNARGR